MRIKITLIFVGVMSIGVLAICARADIFEQYNEPSVLRAEALRLDRMGYEASLFDGGYVGGSDRAGLPSSFRRNWSAKSVADIDLEEVFDKDLRRLIERDRKSTTSLTPALSNNALLLMSYASPAMADVLKHYRIVALTRLNMEYDRAAQKDSLSSGVMGSLYRASLDACLYQKRTRGLLGAMEVCKKEPALGHIKDLSGRFVLKGKPWSMVTDALIRTGLAKRVVRMVVSLAGDLNIDPQGIEEVAPTQTWDTMLAEQANEQMSEWIKVLKNFFETKRVTDIELEMLSWPGFFMTRSVFDDLLTLTAIQRVLFLSRAARLSVVENRKNDLQEAILAFDRAMGRLGVDEPLKRVLRAKKEVLVGILTEQKGRETGFKASAALLENLLEDADTVRKEVFSNMKDEKNK